MAITREQARAMWAAYHAIDSGGVGDSWGGLPLRPWWRRTLGSSIWHRAGGYCANSPDNARAIDRRYPIPAPPPAVGQVWAVPDTEEPRQYYERPIQAVWVVPGGRRVVERGVTATDANVWPPAGGLLLSGPGAPWAPPDYDPEPP